MTDDERLNQLLDAWQSSVDEGRNLTPNDLCQDFPDLLPRLAAEIDLLNHFQKLAYVELHTSKQVLDTTPPNTPRYQFLSFVARGGMGEVWRALDMELKRDVAVKILKSRLGGPPQRFRAEAELVARLEHPGIVPVYDAGFLANGRPFFAMKLIQGRPQDVGMRGPPPTLEELLARRTNPSEDLPRFIGVFQQACEAVAYAHALAPPVLHRDLKPSNIMVGAFGEVLVMDWGIAKILETSQETNDSPATVSGLSAIGDGDTGNSADTDADREVVCMPASTATAEYEPRLETKTGEAKGTIAYMPPEQARGEKQAIGPPADVFALGGVLCTILTGRPPHSGSGIAAFEQARIGDLAEPFARLDKCGADQALVALAKRCLASNASERYVDAGDLARTVSAYRAGIETRLHVAELEKVRVEGERAQTEQAIRHERRRRKLQQNLGGTIVLALLIGAGISTWQARRAIHAEADTADQLELTREAEASAIQQRNVAIEQEHLATKVRFVLVEVLAQSSHIEQIDAGRTPNPNLTVREAIDNTIRTIEGKFEDQPLVEAEFRRTIGLCCANLGSLLQAENQSRRALELFQQALGADHLKTLHCQAHLASILLNRQKLVAAQELLMDAVEKAKTRLGMDDPFSLELEFELGQAFCGAEKTWPKGEGMMLASFARHKQVLGSDHEDSARVAMRIGEAYVGRGELAKAEPLLEKALSVQKEKFGSKHYDTLKTMARLGFVFMNTGRSERGEPLLLAAISGNQEVAGDTSPFTLESLNLLGKSYAEHGRLADAQPLLARAVDASKKVKGHSDPYTIETMYQLAIVDVELDKFDEAILLLEELIALFERIGHRNWGYHEARMVLGQALLGKKNYKAAEETLLPAYKGLTEHLAELPKETTSRRMWKSSQVLVSLYEAIGKKTEVAKWQAENAKYPKPK